MRIVESPDITFVIPVRNDASGLRRCLQSILRSRGTFDVELLVVDNGSTDDSAAIAREFGAKVVELPGLKVAALRNTGAALARARVLAFVDADHEIGPAWIDAALETLQHPGTGAAGRQYSAPEPPTWVQRIYDALRRVPAGIDDVEWLGSGNLVVRSDAFASIGGFDATLEACEDVDLCQRLQRAGYRLLSDSRMRSVHHGDPPALKNLFLSELWRGRDNFRVTVRGRKTFSNLRSLALPLLELLCLGILAARLAFTVPAVLWIASGLALLALTLSRSALLYRRIPDARLSDLARAFAVVSAYDLGRALALIVRFPSRRARATAAAP